MTYRFTRSTSTVLKPLLALLLVMHHLTYCLPAAWLAPFRSLGAPIVSIFLFSSSYGLYNQYITHGPAYLDHFFARRVWKVLAPFLAVLVLYELFLGSPAHFLSDLYNQCVYGIVILPNAWFVEVIILLYVFFYLTFRYLPDKWRTPAVWGLTLLYMAIAVNLHFGRCWWVSVLAFPAGLCYAQCEDRLRAVPVLAGAGLAALLLYLTGNVYCWAACYVFIPVLVVAAASCCRLERLQHPAVTFVAGFSYEIYLCHGIWINVLSDTRVACSDGLFVASVYALTLLSAALVHGFLQKSGLLNIGPSESRSNR